VLAIILSGWGPALAQVERRELPVLPGESPAPHGLGGPAGESRPGSGYRRPALPQSPSSLPEAASRAPEASALPLDAWRGLGGAAQERLLAQISLPSPSPALTKLIAQALATDPKGEGGEVRLAALERAGRVEELAEALRGFGGADEPGAARYALALLAEGRGDEACAMELGAGSAAAPANSNAKRAAFLIPAYCAAAEGDKDGASLALSLARDSGIDAGLAANAIDRLAKGASRGAVLPRSVDVLDYLFLKLGQAGGSTEIAARATPELLFLLAQDEQAPAELRLAAAERAAALNIIDGEGLGSVYRKAAPQLAKSAQSPAALRAKLFATLEGQAAAKIRAESIEALLASGKDARIEIPIAEALAQANAGLAEDPQAAGFAETGVRVAALAGEDQAAWEWADTGGEHVRSWQLLLGAIDPVDERARAALDAGVEIALKTEVPGPLLQRLVTVLDALDEEVPIPLWELAGKTPQPEDGYLPETGLLTTLKEAADAGEVGRTVLLVAAALGPNGPPGAHLIALGDGLRALKRVGLDAEARRIAFEALYAHWPARGKV
jgi:hypothetical protein